MALDIPIPADLPAASCRFDEPGADESSAEVASKPNAGGRQQVILAGSPLSPVDHTPSALVAPASPILGSALCPAETVS